MTRPTVSVTLGGTEIGTYVNRIRISAGNTEGFQAPSPSRCTIDVTNASREFDPGYSSGTFYSYLDGDLIVRIDENPTYYTLFGGAGILNQVHLDWFKPGDALAAIEAYGALALLARAEGEETAGGSDTALEHLNNAVADLAALSGATVVARGGGDDSWTTVNDIDTGDNVVTYIGNVIEGEIGWLHDYDAAEDLVFVSRTQRWAISVQTFSDSPTGTEIDYDRFTASYRFDNGYSGVSAQRDGGTEQRWPDVGYAAPTLNIGGLVLADDDQVLDLAKQRYDKPSSFVRAELVINADAVDSTDCWNFVKRLGRESATDTYVGIGARVTIDHNPPGSGGDESFDYFVEGWEMDIPSTADSPWLVTLFVSSAEYWPAGAFTLDDATYGVLDDDILG